MVSGSRGCCGLGIHGSGWLSPESTGTERLRQSSAHSAPTTFVAEAGSIGSVGNNSIGATDGTLDEGDVGKAPASEVQSEYLTSEIRNRPLGNVPFGLLTSRTGTTT